MNLSTSSSFTQFRSLFSKYLIVSCNGVRTGLAVEEIQGCILWTLKSIASQPKTKKNHFAFANTEFRWVALGLHCEWLSNNMPGDSAVEIENSTGVWKQFLYGRKSLFYIPLWNSSRQSTSTKQCVGEERSALRFLYICRVSHPNLM